MADENKLKALDAAIAQIEKQYGKGSVMKLGDPSAAMNVETVPTGSLPTSILLKGQLYCVFTQLLISLSVIYFNLSADLKQPE